MRIYKNVGDSAVRCQLNATHTHRIYRPASISSPLKRINFVHNDCQMSIAFMFLLLRHSPTAAETTTTRPQFRCSIHDRRRTNNSGMKEKNEKNELVACDRLLSCY